MPRSSPGRAKVKIYFKETRLRAFMDWPLLVTVTTRCSSMLSARDQLTHSKMLDNNPGRMRLPLIPLQKSWVLLAGAEELLELL